MQVRKDYNFTFKIPSVYKDKHLLAGETYFKWLAKHHPELKVVGLEKDGNRDDEQIFPSKRGIGYITPGAIVEFNCNEKYDVDWWKNEILAEIKGGIVTELELIEDWDRIITLTTLYCKANYPYSWNHEAPEIMRPEVIAELSDTGSNYTTELPSGLRVTHVAGAIIVEGNVDGKEIMEVVPTTNTKYKAKAKQFRKIGKTIIREFEL